MPGPSPLPCPGAGALGVRQDLGGGGHPARRAADGCAAGGCCGRACASASAMSRKSRRACLLWGQRARQQGPAWHRRRPPGRRLAMARPRPPNRAPVSPPPSFPCAGQAGGAGRRQVRGSGLARGGRGAARPGGVAAGARAGGGGASAAPAGPGWVAAHCPWLLLPGIAGDAVRGQVWPAPAGQSMLLALVGRVHSHPTHSGLPGHASACQTTPLP